MMKIIEGKPLQVVSKSTFEADLRNPLAVEYLAEGLDYGLRMITNHYDKKEYAGEYAARIGQLVVPKWRRLSGAPITVRLQCVSLDGEPGELSGKLRITDDGLIYDPSYPTIPTVPNHQEQNHEECPRFDPLRSPGTIVGYFMRDKVGEGLRQIILPRPVEQPVPV